MKVAVYTKNGEEKETKDLKSPIFDLAVNPSLIQEAVYFQLSNRREASAKTKTRGEVAGGGKKPWKQKGTGRARSGSVRNPIWRGGGITFGPTGLQSYLKRMPKKKKRAAIISALAAKKNDMVVIEDLVSKKTKDLSRISEKVSGKRMGLYVFDGPTETVKKASSNLKNIKVIDYKDINVYELLLADKVVFVGQSFEKLNQFLGNK